MDGERDGLPSVKECGCPWWVLRCLHWEGKWYVLHRAGSSDRPFHICTGEDPPTWAGDFNHDPYNEVSPLRDTEKEAGTDFDEIEARLLERERV